MAERIEVTPHLKLCPGRPALNSIIYLVGLIVVVLAILSFVGIR